MFSISEITLNIDCIVAGFLDDGFPMLLHLDGKGGVNIKEDFAVAGEGGYLAESGLLHRQHSEDQPLEKTLYCVYEAKKYAERVSTVNNVTHIAILSNDGLEFLRKAGKDYFQTLYCKFGPQDIADRIVIDPAFVRRKGEERTLGPKAP